MTVPVVVAATSLDSSSEWISAVVSVVAAGVYVTGMALQQKGNLAVMTRAAEQGTPGDAGARKVLSNGIWWAGMATMVLGFVLHATALGLGSLAVVQPLQVTEIIFMVPASAWVAHVAIRHRDWYAAGAVAAGLALFLIATQPGQGGEVSSGSGSWLVVTGCVFAAVALLLLGARRLPRYRAALLGAMTGVIYGLQGALLKQATGELGDIRLADVATWWGIPAVIAVNVAAIVGQNLAMRAGRLSAALSTITVATPVVSTIIGVTLFGEQLSTTPLALVGAGVGFTITVVGVVLLAASPALLAADEVAAEVHDAEGEARVEEPYFDAPPLLVAEHAVTGLERERAEEPG